MRRVILTVLMLMVLLPSQAFARLAYRCGMDGKLRTACCCPGETSHGASEDTLRERCCCEVSELTAPASPAAELAHGDVRAVPPCVTVSNVIALPVVLRAQRPIAAHAFVPPVLARSLFASRCALLL